MSNLSEDLNKDFKELENAYDKKDIIRGLVILGGIGGEIAGLVAVITATISAIGFVTAGLGSLGIPIAAGVISQIIRRAVPEIVKQYSSLNKSDRTAVRKALRFLGISSDIFAIGDLFHHTQDIHDHSPDMPDHSHHILPRSETLNVGDKVQLEDGTTGYVTLTYMSGSSVDIKKEGIAETINVDISTELAASKVKKI